MRTSYNCDLAKISKAVRHKQQQQSYTWSKQTYSQFHSRIFLFTCISCSTLLHSDPVPPPLSSLISDNAKEALFLMPMSKARERMMLRALHRYGTGPEGCTRAWLSLPHGMRVFYPHAYCRSGIHITCLIAFKYPEAFMVLFVFLLSFVFPSSSSLTLI